MNFNSEGRWGEKREVLAQQGEALLCEGTVETQTALYEATSNTCPCCSSGWMFLVVRLGIATGYIKQREMCTPILTHTPTQAALLTPPTLRAFLTCCAACSLPSSAERIPEVKPYQMRAAAPCHTATQPDRPQRKTLTLLIHS